MAIYFDLQDPGISFHGLQETVDMAIAEDELAVLLSIQNILLTERNSRIYNQRDFGCSLHQFLFEPIDEITAVAIFDEVEFALTQETRIEGLELEIIPSADENTFKIIIEFKIIESERAFIFQTTLEIIR